jgi:uncharacterized metal-binding protein
VFLLLKIEKHPGTWGFFFFAPNIKVLAISWIFQNAHVADIVYTIMKRRKNTQKKKKREKDKREILQFNTM